MHEHRKRVPDVPVMTCSQLRAPAIQVLRDRLETLRAQATDCELIGNLATDESKRADFRRMAEQFRLIAEQLKTEMDEGGNPNATPDEQFLLQQAERCRALAASVSDEKIAAELLRLATEYEEKARAG